MGLANDDAWTPKATQALAASFIISATQCRLRSVLVELASTAPTAVYYVQVFDSATLPDDAAATSARIGPGTIDHTSGDHGDGYRFDFGPNGIAMTSGAVLVLSSTRYTKTIAGAYMIPQAVIS